VDRPQKIPPRKSALRTDHTDRTDDYTPSSSSRGSNSNTNSNTNNNTNHNSTSNNTYNNSNSSRNPKNNSRENTSTNYDEDNFDSYNQNKNKPNTNSRNNNNSKNNSNNNTNHRGFGSEYPEGYEPPSFSNPNPYPDDSGDPYGGETGDTSQQMECPNCNRKFNPKPYQKHVTICAKVNAKRKVFDASKMRVEGNPELIQIMTKNKKEENRKTNFDKKSGLKGTIGGGDGGNMTVGGGRVGGGNRRGPGQDSVPMGNANDDKKSKWKNESNAFRESMKAARQITKAIASGAPLPPPVASAPDSSLVQCPHCSRRFNEKAAERHIPVCTNIRLGLFLYIFSHFFSLFYTFFSLYQFFSLY
jgi:uncharacterized C2H2 Zn-finger protein